MFNSREVGLYEITASDEPPDTNLSDGKFDEEAEVEVVEFESAGQIWRNVLVVSTAFMFMFTAYSSLQSLQSSLFVEEGMGTTILAVCYTSFLVSAFFTPVPLVSLLGSKWTICITMGCYMLFVTAHFYPSWSLFIPSGIILGLGAAPLWATKAHYLNAVAHSYAKLKGVSNAEASSLFFGVFFLFFQLCFIWGNIISGQVLTPADRNTSVSVHSSEEFALCGKEFCPQKASNNTNLEMPTTKQLYTLAVIYTGCACVAMIILFILLQQLPSERKRKFACSREICQPQTMIATFLQLKDYRQLLLLPLTMYSGLEQAFFHSDYTQAFITCPLGKSWVGYVLICYGIAAACSSLIFGKLVKLFGQVPLLMLAAVTHAGLTITFLHLNITGENIYIYFVFAGLWGMADAIWQTQISALYGVLFKENSEAAFANLKLWEALGFIIAFGSQSHLCLPPKAYMLLSLLALGITGCGVVVLIERRKNKSHL